MLPEWISSKTGGIPDGPVNVPCDAVVSEGKCDARAVCGAVGLDAFELQGDPVIAVARVAIKDALIAVAGQRAAHLFEYVFVAVVLNVAEGDGVAFLQMTEATGRRDILKNLALVVAKHFVRQKSLIRRVTGSE